MRSEPLLDHVSAHGSDATRPSLWPSFFVGGFECATHRRADGKRLDLIAATDHERLAAQDYAALKRNGIAAARDGVRWHLIESRPGRYDWSSVLPMIRAARRADVLVAWDLCHYGWPDYLDIMKPDFTMAFARFAGAFARLLREETGEPGLFCPVNEISFWAWAGGDKGYINPCLTGQGGALKRRLVRAAIAAMDAVRLVSPHARFLLAEPLIHVEPRAPAEADAALAHAQSLGQFEAFDMLSGRLAPELGGHPRYLDIVGVNYYPHNQWYWEGSTIPMGHHSYQPLRQLLARVSERYGRPMIIAETSAEGTARGPWLNYVCCETQAAIASGVPIEAICLYPVTDYPGWDNDRMCRVGLLSAPDTASVQRSVEPALAAEIARWRPLLERRAPPLVGAVHEAMPC